MDVPRILGIVGLVAYLASGWWYLVSGLVVPGPWLFILWGIWVVGLFFAWRTWRTRPVWTLAFAPVAIAFWFIYVTAGEQLLGWAA